MSSTIIFVVVCCMEPFYLLSHTAFQIDIVFLVYCLQMATSSQEELGEISLTPCSMHDRVLTYYALFRFNFYSHTVSPSL